MLQTMIVDDEPLARARLERLLADEADVDVRWICGDGPEAVRLLASHSIDLLFLDVRMPGLDGFAVLDAVDRDRVGSVVFVTAFDNYATRAFEVQALDYLVKPFDRDALLRVLDRVRGARRLRSEADLRARLRTALDHLALREHGLRRIPVRRGKSILLVDVDDIDWIEGAGNYVKLHAGKSVHLHDSTMRALEDELDGSKFCRIHRSTIVNVDRVGELSPLFRGEFAVILKDGTQLKLSRSYRRNLQTLLGTEVP